MEIGLCFPNTGYLEWVGVSRRGDVARRDGSRTGDLEEGTSRQEEKQTERLIRRETWATGYVLPSPTLHYSVWTFRLIFI